MDSKKSPKGRKRTSKGIVVPPVPFPSGDLFWDCSVCTFRNKAEAFKCSMCDVRKGTSTRKPRLNPDIVAAQQAQALTPPPPSTTPTPSGSNSLHWSGDESVTLPGLPDDEVVDTTLQTPLKSNKKVREPKSTKKKEPSKRANANTIPRLKNVDRSSATYHSVTVNDFTVVITEFKPKVKKEKKAKVNKVKPVIIQLHAKNSLASNASTLSVPQDEDSSRTSRSPSVSCDGMGSDENSRPNGHLLSNS